MASELRDVLGRVVIVGYVAVRRKSSSSLYAIQDDGTIVDIACPPSEHTAFGCPSCMCYVHFLKLNQCRCSIRYD